MWRDEHTGLYHTHYRLYDPQHVRWLTPDPAGYRDGQNLYRFYAGPNGVDVLGLDEIELNTRTSVENAKSIIRDGLIGGDRGLIWTGTPGADPGMGRQGKAETPITLKLKAEVADATEIASNILDKLKEEANELAKNESKANFQKVRDSLYYDKLKEYISKSKGDSFWISVKGGKWYIFKQTIARKLLLKGYSADTPEAKVAIESEYGENLFKEGVGPKNIEKAEPQTRSQKIITNTGKYIGYGGKVLFVYAATNDAVSFYSAENKTKEGVRIVSAWTAAYACGSIGAEIGVIGGPFAEITVPLFGITGGAFGYYGGSLAVEEALGSINYQEGIPLRIKPLSPILKNKLYWESNPNSVFKQKYCDRMLWYIKLHEGE